MRWIESRTVGCEQRVLLLTGSQVDELICDFLFLLVIFRRMSKNRCWVSISESIEFDIIPINIFFPNTVYDFNI